MGSSEIFPINAKIREELKHPLGQLILDDKVSSLVLSQFFENESTITVCVGDRTTERIHELGFSPNLEIVDSLEKRVARNYPKIFEQNRIVLSTTNPPGSISREAMKTLGQSLQLINESRQTKIRVEIKGEEDLLVLPIVAFFPEPTFALYGQPNVGMVVVSSKIAKERSRTVLQEMGLTSFS
ncbi:MAG: DUF359 domain-containing protein [Nitrososphaerales archaeon]